MLCVLSSKLLILQKIEKQIKKKNIQRRTTRTFVLPSFLYICSNTISSAGAHNVVTSTSKESKDQIGIHWHGRSIDEAHFVFASAEVPLVRRKTTLDGDLIHDQWTPRRRRSQDQGAMDPRRLLQRDVMGCEHVLMINSWEIGMKYPVYMHTYNSTSSI
jgi:hypothetical protein